MGNMSNKIKIIVMSFQVQLLVFLPFSEAQSCLITPQGSNCAENPSEPSNVNPAPPEIVMPDVPLFSTHQEAERNYYHCEEGVAIMGAAIVQLLPTFIPVLSTEDFVARAGQVCVSPKFEIYPDSGICNAFESQEVTEEKYKACRTTNFQYWDLLVSLQKPVTPPVPPCMDGGDFFDGKFSGALWKPVGDPKASCRNRTVVILPPEYAAITEQEIEILDVNFKQIDKGIRKVNLEKGRPVWCTSRVGSQYGNQSLVVRYKVNGVDECRTVQDPSKRED